MAPSETEDTREVATENGSDLPAAERVIELFGGIRPMASKLNVTASTVQGWKARGHIPASRAREIREAAGVHGIELDQPVLNAATTSDPTPNPSSGSGMTDQQPSTASARQWAPDATPPQRETRHDRTLGAVALAVALVALILAILLPFFLDDGDAVEQRLAGLADRLDSIEARPDTDPAGAIADLGDRVAALEGDSDTVAGLARDVPRLEDRLDDLDTRTANVAGSDEAAALAGDVQFLRNGLADVQDRVGALSDTVDALSDRLDTAEPALDDLRASIDRLSSGLEGLAGRLDALDAGRAGLLLAVSQLREDVLAGRDFSEALNLVAGLGEGDEAVETAVGTLAGLDGPVPTLDMLTGQFGAAAAAARDADREPPTGWLDEALDGVGGLVSVRPAPGENDGSDTASILARAEGRLLDGNLTGASEAIGALNVQAAAAMADWTALLDRRIAAEAALSALAERAIRHAAAE